MSRQGRQQENTTEAKLTSTYKLIEILIPDFAMLCWTIRHLSILSLFMNLSANVYEDYVYWVKIVNILEQQPKHNS